MKTVAYLRVSTAQQDVRSQRLAILEHARGSNDFRIDDFIEATASGQVFPHIAAMAFGRDLGGRRFPEGRRFRYILLATNRTGTMQREMNEAPPEYSFAGMTVFDTRFGGNEAAVILEAEITDD